MSEPIASKQRPAAGEAGTRPRLLVSVRDLAEAAAAVDGGADWIDLKEPLNGPLGAVEPGVAAEVAVRLSGRLPLSAALGELLDWPPEHWQAWLRAAGVAYLKLGLAGQRAVDWQAAWVAAYQQCAAAGKQLVAVIYADSDRAASPPPEEIIQLAASAGCRWILWDTFDKSRGTLADHAPLPRLRDQLDMARRSGCLTAAAGSLSIDVIARLPLELIDMIAVRTAACRGGRQGAICSERVALLQRAISASFR